MGSNIFRNLRGVCSAPRKGKKKKKTKKSNLKLHDTTHTDELKH